MNVNYLTKFLSSVSLQCQLEICCHCSLTVNSVFFSAGSRVYGPPPFRLLCFWPPLNVIEDPCSMLTCFIYLLLYVSLSGSLHPSIPQSIHPSIHPFIRPSVRR